MKRSLLALFALWVSIGSLPASGATFTALSLVEDPLAWGVQANLPAQACVLSGNGLVTAFASSASNLVAADRNGVLDVFVRSGASLVRASRRLSGAEARALSDSPSLSDSGRYVAFISRDDLLETGVATVPAAYWLDRQTLTLKVASRNLSGATGIASQVAISGDGRYVVYESVSSSILPGDSNNANDIFLFDTQSETTTLVSATASGAFGDGSSFSPSVSDSGEWVAFDSTSTNFLVGDNSIRDVFVKNMLTGAIVRASQSTSGIGANQSAFKARLSASGNVVVFESTASNLDAASIKGVGITDVFRHVLSSGATELVSSGLAGAAANGASSDASVSTNGRYVWFKSRALNLVSPTPSSTGQLYRRDMNNGSTLQATNSSREIFLPSSSDDGQSACFQTAGALEAADSNGHVDIYLVNVSNGVPARQSVADSAIASPFAARGSGLGDVTIAATEVVGYTLARELDADSFAEDVEMPQVAQITPASGEIQLMGRNGLGELPDNQTEIVSLSADGQWAVIETFAGNLSVGDSNGNRDTYRIHQTDGALTLVSRNPDGSAAGSVGASLDAKPRISHNGSRVAFRSAATTLVANDNNGLFDAFVWDVGPPVSIRRVNVSSNGTEANDAVEAFSMDASGEVIAFVSRASNLVSGDSNGANDVFVHSTQSGQTVRVSRNSAGAQLGVDSGSPTISPDGRFIAYLVDAGGANEGIFLYDRLADSQIELQISSSVRVLADSLQFGRDPRYLSYIGAIGDDSVAFRYDRFSTQPNLALANTPGFDDYGPLNISQLQLGSATKAVLETNQPLATSDRNRESDLLLVTLSPGVLSFANTSITVGEAAGTIDIPILRLNGSEGFVGASGGFTPGTAGSTDYAIEEDVAGWESGITAQQNLRLRIVDDALMENDETLSVALTHPHGGATLGTPMILQITITDNDAPDALFANGFE